MATTTVDLSAERLELGPGAARARTIAFAVGALGVLGSLALGFAGDAAAEKHMLHAWLTSFVFWLSLSLGGLFFVLMMHLTRAGWSVSVRRVAECVGASVLVMIPLAAVVLVGMDTLYPWMENDPADTLNVHKSPYLNQTFFVIRLVVYFVVWVGLTGFFLSRSTRQDATGDPRLTRSMEKWSAPGTLLFAMTVTFAAFDLLMSLYPHWFSTIFGVYYFAGCFLGFIAFFILLLMYLQAGGHVRRVVGIEHYHDLGKILFAFVVFWAYIAFSQYMLIWYGNLAEETVWYKYRQTGDWTVVSVALLVGHFILPFLFLISRHPKRNRLTLGIAAVWLLVMHWVDMYWLVMPAAYKGVVPFGVPEVTTFLGIGGLFVGFVLWRLGKQALVPVRDPRLQEALQFENA